MTQDAVIGLQEETKVARMREGAVVYKWEIERTEEDAIRGHVIDLLEVNKVARMSEGGVVCKWGIE